MDEVIASGENLKSSPGQGEPADLLNLYARHDGYCSDKWEANLNRYVSLFEPWRNRPVRFLEVGVQNGGSLEIWAQFFPGASIIAGCDIDQRCSSLRFADSRIHLVIGDILHPDTRSQVGAVSREFDVIIDDGSHRSDDIVGTFCSLFPALAEGGLYLIEDLHCSYWQNFQGGLFAPHSAISFLKKLCDVVNHQHWGIPAASGFVLNGPFREHAARITPEQLEHIHSIEFANSLCIIRKERPDCNTLGRRIIAGRQALIHPVILSLPRDRCVPPDQGSNEWSRPVSSPPEAVNEAPDNSDAKGMRTRIHQDEVAALQSEIEQLRAGILGLQTELSTLKRLWSWRLMRPFRNLWRLPGRIRRQMRARFR